MDWGLLTYLLAGLIQGKRLELNMFAYYTHP